MRWITLLCLFLFLPLAIADAKSGVVVVANITNQQVKLSKQQARNLFMGASIGLNLHVVILPADNLARVEFNTKVVGMTESRIQSYWAQMRFSGRRTPPKELPNTQAIIAYLATHPDSVSYLPKSSKIPDGLTVIYQTE